MRTGLLHLLLQWLAFVYPRKMVTHTDAETSLTVSDSRGTETGFTATHLAAIAEVVQQVVERSLASREEVETHAAAGGIVFTPGQGD